MRRGLSSRRRNVAKENKGWAGQKHGAGMRNRVPPQAMHDAPLPPSTLHSPEAKNPGGKAVWKLSSYKYSSSCSSMCVRCVALPLPLLIRVCNSIQQSPLLPVSRRVHQLPQIRLPQPTDELSLGPLARACWFEARHVGGHNHRLQASLNKFFFQQSECLRMSFGSALRASIDA